MALRTCAPRWILLSDRPLYIHTDGEILAGWGMDVRQTGAEILPGEITVMA